ncbi:hypothetical protein M1P56_17455 [Streptomyces sp. HU2014]|uniref:Secreted protein n=1 Tax=Streptomyces albireticuli TaxID=1940 RepID=A0A1Z2KUJ2_9ACTN|nr:MULTISPECIES: hypothetical protein [Streptomyces]ARZ65699.1 hypothetical protein SMD11_0031 [Streptomyces albireticuli]UQI46009.1 hypothetical protein M1P56_17455 [Streptomyces sp. HU2014]
MSRRISALAASAALAGGLLFTAVPAHAATSGDAAAVTARAAITCNKTELRKKIKDLTDLANKNKRLGNPEIAKKKFAEAAAMKKQLAACIKADKDSKGPF